MNYQPRFNIYHISENGNTSWCCTREADSPAEAMQMAKNSTSVKKAEGGIFFAVDPKRNPNGERCVFRTVNRTITSVEPSGLA